MPKRKRKSLSTLQLLDLAHQRIHESREILWDFQQKMQRIDDKNANRARGRQVSVFDEGEIIVQREYISQFSPGNRPNDLMRWLFANL